MVAKPSGFYSPAGADTGFAAKNVSTLNSHHGLFSHANTYRLRKHIYQHELGQIKRFSLPDGAD